MFDLRTQLQGWSRQEQREITYFLIRYFKQSRFLERSGKNIFDDVFDRTPLPEIREATLAAAQLIEGDVGRPATNFDDNEAVLVLDYLISVNDELRSGLSREDYERASAFLSRLK